MSSEYDDWTVARLKDELRERNLTISGKKSILIERLIEDDQTDMGDKIEFDCQKCNSILRVSAEHKGRVKCPNCGYIQRISEKNEFTERVQDLGKKIQESTQNLGQNHLAVGLSIAGVVLLLISIILFFSAFGVSCPVEYMGTEIVNGQEYDTCTDANGNEMWIGQDNVESMFDKIGLACGLLLPMSVALTATGLFIRKDSGSPYFKTENNASIDTNQDNAKTASIVDSRAMKIVQMTSLGIVSGVGIIGTIIFILILLVILVFFILLIWFLIQGGGFGF